MMLCRLRLSAPSRRDVATPSPRAVTSTATVLWEAATALVGSSPFRPAATASHATTTGVVPSIRVRSWTSLFHVDLFSADEVGVGRDSRVVAGRVGEFDKGTILARRRWR